MKIKNYKLKIIYLLIFFSLINLYSCCIFKTDDPDLRITGQNFPSQVRVSETFYPTFTVGNFSNGDCDAARTSQSIVNLRMVNRESGTTQVNNNYTLNSLDNNEVQISVYKDVVKSIHKDKNVVGKIYFVGLDAEVEV